MPRIQSNVDSEATYTYVRRMKTDPRTSPRATAEVMEQVAQLSYSFGFSGNLRPAQWAALRYFGRAQEAARTVSAFADHNHTSRSSASQTIHVLVGRGLLVRRPAPGDRRSHRLDLTEEAHVLLRKDPLQELVGSIGEMSERERFELAERLEQLLKSLMRRRLARRRAS